jgi:uncharacterized membrane protein YfcA
VNLGPVDPFYSQFVIISGMTWHDLLPLAVFFVTFAASLLSGMAGGGGGFIITPFYIAIGLTPQQAIATGKFASFGLGAGAVAAFRERLLAKKGFTIFIIIIAALTGVASSFLIRSIKNEHLQLLMGVMILIMVPFLLISQRGLKSRRPGLIMQTVGSLALAMVLLLQGILSSGIGSLVSVILIIFFGSTALEANVMKRKASIALNIVVVAGLVGSGLINYRYGLFGMAGGLSGGYIGSRIALREGEAFARWALIGFMLVSGVWLVATA